MLIYITGGVRSGKSRYAVELAKRMAQRVVFVATCIPKDAEMRRRVERHRRDRPQSWKTLENRLDLAGVFAEIDARTELVLLDCLTLFVSWRLMQKEGESEICARVDKLCRAAASSRVTTIIVSNEVGSGLVPSTVLGRKFQNIAGFANQIVARRANEAYLMVSGLPVRLKGNPGGTKG